LNVDLEVNSPTTSKLLRAFPCKRWGSLNSILPILSEANPKEFLIAVEKAINASSSPFDELFDQEDTGAFGRNYITGATSGFSLQIISSAACRFSTEASV
jgi:hypothetical protein